MNTLWSTFGCDVPGCNSYPVLALTANVVDSKASFIANYITQLGGKGVYVAKEDGGTAIDDLFKNNKTAGTTYLIKPDKSYRKNMSTSPNNFLLNGVKPHTHSTAINTPCCHHKTEAFAILPYQPHTKSFSVVVDKPGTYTIGLFTLRGTLIENLSLYAEAPGNRAVRICSRKEISAGMYMVQMSGMGKVISNTIKIE